MHNLRIAGPMKRLKIPHIESEQSLCTSVLGSHQMEEVVDGTAPNTAPLSFPKGSRHRLWRQCQDCYLWQHFLVEKLRDD
jgi:hypothetical protein